MSQTLSLRVPDELMERIDRFARQLGNGTTRSRASVLLIDEALREENFVFMTVCVEKSQYSMIKVLKEHGFEPIPIYFYDHLPFGGSFHCATLDV